MLNISFTGDLFRSNNTPISSTEIRYRGFFYQVNGSSSSSTWNNIKLSETGQYNINLGDGDWLTQDGIASPGDKVLLLFWIPNSSYQDDVNLTEWCFIEHTLTSDSVYVQNVRLEVHHHPTCSFIQTGDYVNEPIIISDNGCHDRYQYEYDGMIHFHDYTRYNEDLFKMNLLPLDTLDIDWGDGNHTTNESLIYTPWNHIYTSPGDYTITCIIQNTTHRLECQEEFDIHVVYHVTNGLIWDEPVYLGSGKDYYPNVGGDTNQISGVDYYIDGVPTYLGLDFDESFNHIFSTPGNHLIRQCIKYNDGFVEQVQCEDFTVQIESQASFSESEFECGLQFTDTSIVGNPPITFFNWTVTEGLFVLAHVEGVDYNSWNYAWPYTGSFRVRMSITDSNNNTSSVTKEYIVDECQNAKQGGSGGMGGSSITHTVYKDKPLPCVDIIRIDDKLYKQKDICVISVKDEDLLI